MARLESTEQIILINRIRHFHQGILCFAIPNGGKRDPKEAARLKREGVLAGIPDIMVAEARGQFHGLFIEMKKADGGRTSAEQRQRIAELKDRGYRVEVCHGVDEGYDVFLRYLSLAGCDE